MLRILTPFVILHWAVMFSLLAFLCLLAGDDGVTRAFGFMGLSFGDHTAMRMLGASETSILALALAVCGVLFWWALLETLLGAGDVAQRGNQVLDTAFSGAVGTLTIVSFLGAAHGVAGLLPAIAVQLCALLVSYCAVALTGHRVLATGADRALVEDVRKRAGEASHAASLVRFSARNSIVGSD